MDNAELFDLIKKFNKEMNDLYKRLKKEAGYYSEMNSHILSILGGYEAAKRFIHYKEDTSGLKLLAGKKRLDLSVENLVLKEQYKNLFTEAERDICKKRLDEYSKLSV